MKKEKRAKDHQNKNDKQQPAQNSSSRPTSTEQISQNFRENSGANTKDSEKATDGLSDYR